MDKVKKEIHYWCRDTSENKYIGQGVTAAVLDTGLAPHPDFEGRIAAFKDCVEGKPFLYDDSGHGTHVSGILAGDGKLSGGVLAGMAPGARIVGVKVLDQKGDGNMGQILHGLSWVKQNCGKLGIQIVNISVGARAGIEAEKEEKLIEAVEELWDMGLVVIVSAGNYGPEEGSVTIPGTSRKVITVGALQKGKKMECSGKGPTRACVVKPDICAPGSQIISCSNVPYAKRPYAVKSGTSMAAPVVSGAAALLLSKYPEMSNVEIKLRLRECCREEMNVARLLG